MKRKSLISLAVACAAWCAVAGAVSAPQIVDLINEAMVSSGTSPGVREVLPGQFPGAVPEEVVEHCAGLVRLNKPGNLEEVGQILAKYGAKPSLSVAERAFMLNDAYLRIAQKAGRITTDEAKDALRLLGNIEGVHTTLRKACSVNPAQSAGHLYEFKQALELKRNGFDVLGLGVKYSDGVKKGLTDLDLLVRKENQIFLVESKHYTSGIGAPEVIRADAQSLRELEDFLNARYGKSIKVRPVFTFVAQPSTLLARQLEKKGIPFVVGNGKGIAAAFSAVSKGKGAAIAARVGSVMIAGKSAQFVKVPVVCEGGKMFAMSEYIAEHPEKVSALKTLADKSSAGGRVSQPVNGSGNIAKWLSSPARRGVSAGVLTFVINEGATVVSYLDGKMEDDELVRRTALNVGVASTEGVSVYLIVKGLAKGSGAVSIPAALGVLAATFVIEQAGEYVWYRIDKEIGTFPGITVDELLFEVDESTRNRRTVLDDLNSLEEGVHVSAPIPHSDLK